MTDYKRVEMNQDPESEKMYSPNPAEDNISALASKLHCGSIIEDTVIATGNDNPEKCVDETIIVKKNARIVHQEHAPEWLIDNKFILHGYRVDFHHKWDLFKSLFMKHNELMNIWTHLIGGMIFIGLVVYTLLYFNTFSIIYNKLVNFLTGDNMKLLKDALPDVLQKIE